MYGPSGPFLLVHLLCRLSWRSKTWPGSPARKLIDSLAIGDGLKLCMLLTPQGRNGVFGEPVQVQPLGLGALKDAVDDFGIQQRQTHAFIDCGLIQAFLPGNFNATANNALVDESLPVKGPCEPFNQFGVR